jgi:hypothetical protein
MADSGNILSILAALGQSPETPAPPVNVMQGLPDAPDGNYYPSQPAAPVAPPAPEPVAPTAATVVPDEEHPRKRRSVIDTIGRLADVFATVGGAQALYQPTLDSREDRTLKLGDHARQVDLDALKKTLTQQQVTEGALEPQIAARKRLGTALGALANNPNAADLWPSVAEQAGITDPQQIAAIGQQLQQNPQSAGIFAKALGADIDNLGKNVYFGTGPEGKTVAYQVGPDGSPHILDFSASGVTPSDPIKIVDTGGGQVIVGASGIPKRILPKTARPDTILTTTTNRDIAAGHDRTNITIAGMPARSKTAGGSDTGTGDALSYLDNISRGFDDLHKLGALPGDASGLGAVEGAVSRSAIGQKVGEQMGSPAAQKRLELVKNINSLQSEMIKSLPGSATRTKFEQEIQKARLPDPTKMSYATAQRVIGELKQQYQRALQASAKEVAGTAAKAAPQKSGGWSVVKVQ